MKICISIFNCKYRDFGSKSSQKFDVILLLNDSVQRNVPDIATNADDQVIEGIKKSVYFADECADVNNHAIIFLCFVTYEEGNCKELHTGFPSGWVTVVAVPGGLEMPHVSQQTLIVPEPD